MEQRENDRAEAVLAEVWRGLGGPPELLDDVALTGYEPVLPSSFRVGTAAQVSIAAAALGAIAFDHLRSGRRQHLAVDMLHAAVECRSEHQLRVAGQAPGELWDELAGAYSCAHGIVRLHTNFPHHKRGIVDLLGGASTRPAVAAALSAWDAGAFEQLATARGLCVAVLRRFTEWDAHPQAAEIGLAPLIALTRIGDAPPRAWKPAERPLEGVRVLDLTRVIAGPVAGRTLAAHGADVLRLKGAHVPTFDALDRDTGRGKRSAIIDLDDAAGRSRLDTLAGQAHVFLQSYRPGVLARHGFGTDDLAERHPGLVVAELSAYGRSGPWGGKRGFDSLVQTTTGFNAAEADAAGEPPPRPLPAQILDHASGHLLAAGITTAVRRQAEMGGFWHVEVSLARTAAWLRGLGRLGDGFAADTPTGSAVEPLIETRDGIAAVRHAAQLDQTPPRWDRGPTPYGHDSADW